jgi:hypothetical protein
MRTILIRHNRNLTCACDTVEDAIVAALKNRVIEPQVIVSVVARRPFRSESTQVSAPISYGDGNLVEKRVPDLTRIPSINLNRQLSLLLQCHPLFSAKNRATASFAYVARLGVATDQTVAAPTKRSRSNASQPRATRC